MKKQITILSFLFFNCIFFMEPVICENNNHDWSFIPKKEPIKLMEENFPIEKLQAMIHK